MSKYRFLPTSVWSNDVFIKMSPEQKLIYIYLVTSPYTTMCGIFNLSVSTMGHFLGLRNDNIESAFKGFLLAFSDWVQYDEKTGEVALLYWPKFALVNANIGAIKKAERELEEVQSMELLKAVIERNSATLSKMYLKRLRQLHTERLNREKTLFNTCTPYQTNDVAQVPENEASNLQNEKEKETIIYKDQNAHFDQDMFLTFWEVFGNKVGKKRAATAFKRLTKKNKKLCIDKIPEYKKYLKTTGISQMHPTTWINGERWNDDFSPPQKYTGANTDDALNDQQLTKELERQYQVYISHVIDKFPALWKSKCKVFSKSEWYKLTQTHIFPNLRIALTDRRARHIRGALHALLNEKAYERAKYTSLFDAVKDEYQRHINREKTMVA